MKMTAVQSWKKAGMDEEGEFSFWGSGRFFSSSLELIEFWRDKTKDAREQLMDLGRGCAMVEDLRLRICDSKLLKDASEPLPDGTLDAEAIQAVYDHPSTIYVTLDKYTWTYSLGICYWSSEAQIQNLRDYGWVVEEFGTIKPTLLNIRREYFRTKVELGWKNARINRSFKRAHKGTLRFNFRGEQQLSLEATTVAYAKVRGHVIYTNFDDTKSAVFSEDVAALIAAKVAGPPPKIERKAANEQTR